MPSDLQNLPNHLYSDFHVTDSEELLHRQDTTRPDLSKIVGRADEQIVPSNGEKSNLVPLGPGVADLHGPRTPQDLWRYVDRFLANFPARPMNLVERPSVQKDVVVITGTTGGFGCDALEHLLRDETVERVYAFNRKGTDALELQRKQFAARGLDGTLLNSPKFRMVEAVLHEPGFGIDAKLVEEIRTSATHILLNAWKVNLNLSITSFEPDMQGVRNFIDLALSSPCANAPVVMLVSSISVLWKWDGACPVPEVSIDDPTSPFGAGYSESKKRRGSGARAFVEMRHSLDPIVHLVHPRPVPWNTVVAPIAQELDVPLVPFTEWLSKLESSVEKGSKSAEGVEATRLNPALRFLSLFKMQGGIADGALWVDAMGFPMMGTDKAVQVSESLVHLPQLDGERVMMWLAAWRKSGTTATSCCNHPMPYVASFWHSILAPYELLLGPVGTKEKWVQTLHADDAALEDRQDQQHTMHVGVETNQPSNDGDANTRIVDVVYSRLIPDYRGRQLSLGSSLSSSGDLTFRDSTPTRDEHEFEYEVQEARVDYLVAEVKVLRLELGRIRKVVG
ncbi:hypothetical protein V8D89_003423 [Ganoderma adspersum]